VLPEPSVSGRIRKGVVTGLVFAVILAFVLRAFVGDFYTVRSGSMLPTVRLDETVLVRFGGAIPDRFELVVFRDADDAAVVKRAVGLPGESVRLDAGDLLVDGQKPDRSIARGPWVTLFGGAGRDARDFFEIPQGPDGRWSVAASVLSVDASESSVESATWRGDVDDGWLELDGSRHPGTRSVRDVLIELSIVRRSSARPDAAFSVVLAEGCDLFEIVHTGDRLRLHRRHAVDGSVEVLDERPWPLADGEALELALANVDDQVIVHAGGQPLMHVRYTANRAWPESLPGDRHTRAPRVALGVDGCAVDFAIERVARDLHWISSGEFAVDDALQLGLDELFVLGDNSPESADGRFWGPIDRDQLVGRPLAVIRPWSAARWLDTPSTDGQR
jgi:signal peptidase I